MPNEYDVQTILAADEAGAMYWEEAEALCRGKSLPPLHLSCPESTPDSAMEILVNHLRQSDLWDGPPGAEALQLHRDVVAKIGEDEFQVTEPMSEPDLRVFVRDVLAGKVRTSQDVPYELIPLVFFPITVRDPGPKVTEAVQAVAPAPGDCPPLPSGPSQPAAMEEIPEPPPFVEALPDEDRLAQIRRDIDWQVCSASRLNEYLEKIQAANAEGQRLHAKSLRTWKRDKKKQEEAFQKAKADFELAMDKFQQEEAVAKDLREKWNHARDRNRAAWKAANKHYYRRVGLIWGVMEQSLSRGVNGHPMFLTCHYMSIEDAARCMKVIKAEIARRDQIEV